MMQKSNEEIYKALSEAERNLAEKNVGWMDKASKRKENHAAIGKASGEVVFYDGEYVSTLEGLQVFVFKDGKQITAYNWKIEDTYSELSGDISVDINHYEIGEMPASTKEYYLSYGNDFDTAWLNAMYTDVYVYSGKYSNLDAWDQFTQYIAFYDEVVDYDNKRAPAPELYDVYYAYDPDTEEEAGQCVDEVIRIAEESGAEIQFY